MATDLTLVTLKPIRPAGPAITFRLIGQAEVAGGVGGWEVIGRPRRRSITEWAGVEPYTMGMNLLTDRFDITPNVNASVEPKIDQLNRLGLKVPGGAQPPVVTVSGPLPQLPTADGQPILWVVQDIQPVAEDQGAVRNSVGDRIQQWLRVELLQYVAVDIDLSPSKKARDRQKSRGKKTSAKVVRIKRGETLSQLAQKHLGKASRWREIADLNSIRDPRKVPAGTKIRLP